MVGRGAARDFADDGPAGTGDYESIYYHVSRLAEGALVPDSRGGLYAPQYRWARERRRWAEMNERKLMLVMMSGVILLAVAVFGPLSIGAEKAGSGLDTREIGLVDPAVIQKQFPDYLKLVELKKAYDSELNMYTAYLHSQAQSYLTELNKEKEAESEGKSAEQRQKIAAKYAEKQQAKQDEVNQLIQERFKELQDKLNEETAKADLKVQAAIKTVAEQKALAIVLNKSAVYLGGIDISADVIALAQEANDGGQ